VKLSRCPGYASFHSLRLWHTGPQFFRPQFTMIPRIKSSSPPRAKRTRRSSPLTNASDLTPTAEVCGEKGRTGVSTPWARRRHAGVRGYDSEFGQSLRCRGPRCHIPCTGSHCRVIHSPSLYSPGAGGTPVCQGPPRCATPPAPDLLGYLLLTAVSDAPDTPRIPGARPHLDGWGGPGAARRGSSGCQAGRRPDRRAGPKSKFLSPSPHHSYHLIVVPAPKSKFLSPRKPPPSRGRLGQ